MLKCFKHAFKYGNFSIKSKNQICVKWHRRRHCLGTNGNPTPTATTTLNSRFSIRHSDPSPTPCGSSFFNSESRCSNALLAPPQKSEIIENKEHISPTTDTIFL
uniref:Uncharacterized protein n=1 Tax=Panagrolaimus davidi TaxID=227884 RepID=A0A914Q8I5_9BILA